MNQPSAPGPRQPGLRQAEFSEGVQGAVTQFARSIHGRPPGSDGYRAAFEELYEQYLTLLVGQRRGGGWANCSYHLEEALSQAGVGTALTRVVLQGLGRGLLETAIDRLACRDARTGSEEAAGRISEQAKGGVRGCLSDPE